MGNDRIAGPFDLAQGRLFDCQMRHPDREAREKDRMMSWDPRGMLKEGDWLTICDAGEASASFAFLRIAGTPAEHPEAGRTPAEEIEAVLQ